MDARRKSLLLASVVAYVVAALAGLLPAAEPAAPKIHTVLIEGMRYVPAIVELAPGERILFRNNDLMPHTATAKASGAFDSGLIKPGGTWLMQPSGREPIKFVCRYHPTMTGTIVFTRP